jgi:hypothetical protein
MDAMRLAGAVDGAQPGDRLAFGVLGDAPRIWESINSCGAGRQRALAARNEHLRGRRGSPKEQSVSTSVPPALLGLPLLGDLPEYLRDPVTLLRRAL